MELLDRDQYNQKIKALNTGLGESESAVGELTAWHESLFCNLSDYEEIVMLINICIAQDRENNLEDLYENYSRLKVMLENHGIYAIEDYEQILYDMGVLSFKFHDYRTAIRYLKKCGEQIVSKYVDPYGGAQGDIYIKSKILMSYSLEYEGYLGVGTEKAIDNILDDPLTMTETIEEELIKKIKEKPKDMVREFFLCFPSKIYHSASEPMKKEIQHMLAHCFSEYATNLSADENIGPKYKRIYLWEKMAECFIGALGAEMATCKAIILSEHGQYQAALDDMKMQYSSLKENEEKKKAELAFYIYYFSNQIGMDQNGDIEEYKQYFLRFAEKENGDTKVYAWIVEFREKLKNALKVKDEKGVKDLMDLENLIKKVKNQHTDQSYLHPQILREKNRLLLAYQILRSYLNLNENESDSKIDNSLFEKCVLFSRQENTDRLITEKNTDWSAPEHIIVLHNICLCVVGLTKEIHAKLEKEFCTEIPFLKGNVPCAHKVMVCHTGEQLDALENMEKSHLLLFIHCTEEYCSRIQNMVEENVCVETDLIKTFKIAYIQEILERCYQFAYRWDEFFIMAPITDNGTFAFQSQGIESFLELKNPVEEEKGLFSEKKGYATEEFGVLNQIQEIKYSFQMEKEEEITRVFYFSENCLYSYHKARRCFVPYKVVRDLDGIKAVTDKLCKKSKKTDARRKNCKCRLRTKYCLCDEWQTRAAEVCELLMRFSVDMPSDEEKYCTYVWSGNMDGANRLKRFLIILSKAEIRSHSFQKQLNELQDIKGVEADPVDEGEDKDVTKLSGLLDQINEFVEKNSKEWPKESDDYKRMDALREQIRQDIQSKRPESYTNLEKEWKQIRRGGDL